MSCVVIVGCNNEGHDQQVDKDESQIKTDTEKSDDETDESSNKDTNKFEAKKDEPTDEVPIGDPEVRITGTATYENNVLTIEGQTNLVEDASLTIAPGTLDRSTFIGVTGSVLVESDGSFSKEVKIPRDYEHGIYLRIFFRPDKDTNEEVQDLYGEEGEKLEGPFIRSYERIDEIMQEAYTSVYLPLEDADSVTGEFGDPGWQEPEDLGDENIRVEATAEAGKNFIDIQGESNLIEGVELSVSHIDEDDREINSSRNIHTYPDGSFRTWIEIDDEVDSLKETYIKIDYQPTAFNWENTIEQYGENGEKMSGELVEDGRVIVTIPVQE